jgi:hypothetical protein
LNAIWPWVRLRVSSASARLLNANAGAQRNIVEKPRASMEIDPVVDAVKLHEADENEINCDDVTQEPRNQQNENPGEDRDNGCQMGSGNDHLVFLSVLRDLKTTLNAFGAQTGK